MAMLLAELEGHQIIYPMIQTLKQEVHVKTKTSPWLVPINPAMLQLKDHQPYPAVITFAADRVLSLSLGYSGFQKA